VFVYLSRRGASLPFYSVLSTFDKMKEKEGNNPELLVLQGHSGPY
jgi:hypothetical protein